EIDVVIANPDGTQPLRHRIALAEVGQRMAVVDESIENEKAYEDRDAPYFYYKYQRGRPVLNVQGGEERGLRREDLSPDQSVLSQRKDPDSYPVVTYLGRSYEQIRIYQEWNLGRRTAPRRPQDTALDRSFLLPDASNLAPVLNEFEDHPRERREIRDRLQQFLPGVEDFYTRTEGGTIQVYLRERGLESGIAATRLSDGTLRYLLLLSVLCHPDPPPLVCIEEPEIGLHPDVLPTVAELLVSAAERTQLIVTTHSDALLCSPILPEHVVVCERDAEGSHLRRLEPEALRSWLRDYTLGDVWRMGEIGGNRW
ncbi:MAG: AAA family ATPase, partial [Armatimonadetes bacterium]|nr:AAA family ATPase [Armatimonadota bacterium]